MSETTRPICEDNCLIIAISSGYTGGAASVLSGDEKLPLPLDVCEGSDKRHRLPAAPEAPPDEDDVYPPIDVRFPAEPTVDDAVDPAAPAVTCCRVAAEIWLDNCWLYFLARSMYSRGSTVWASVVDTSMTLLAVSCRIRARIACSSSAGVGAGPFR